MTKLVCIAVALGALCGCGSSDGKSPPRADAAADRVADVRSNDTGTPSTSDTAAPATPDTAPPITSAPPAWERPADCGGIGDTCPEGIFGCSTNSMCQLEGYVCVPLAPKTSETRPYCMAYTCMSFEEASCFCTGAAAKQYPHCADGPAAVAGLCAATGDSCASKPCCDGLTCVTSAAGATCQRTCTTGAECTSGCCFDKAETGRPICSDAALCASPCAKIATSCTQSNECCTGLCVTGTTVTDWVGCRPPCNKNEDCSTGCCEMFSDGKSGFCVDSRWCVCGTSGTACGPGFPSCCSDQECSGFANETGYLCRPRCKTTADCPSGSICSPPFSGKDYGVCD